jgi:hypothetical protein
VNTVVGGAAVITATKFSINNTKLWHMRLGHIGESGIAIQEKLVKGSEDLQARILQVLCVWEAT